MSWLHAGAFLSLLMAALALLLLALSPIGWRAGWWHFRFAFAWLMSTSGMIAAAAMVISLLTLLLGRSELGPSDLGMAVIGLCLGAFLAYLPWNYNRLRSAVPRIHDISTDTDNPPAFTAVLPARFAEKAALDVYEGPDLARQQ